MFSKNPPLPPKKERVHRVGNCLGNDREVGGVKGLRMLGGNTVFPLPVKYLVGRA